MGGVRDNIRDGFVSVHYMTKEVKNQEPSFEGFDSTYKHVKESIRPGLKQKCDMNIGKISPEDLKKVKDKDDVFHIVIDIQARPSDDKPAVTRILSYGKLVHSSGKWNVTITAQKSICGGCVSTMEGLFGGFGMLPGASGDNLGEGTDCVICLSNPRDTVILPCRHVCICNTCANVKSSTWSFQCPVCRSRVHKMVKRGA